MTRLLLLGCLCLACGGGDKPANTPEASPVVSKAPPQVPRAKAKAKPRPKTPEELETEHKAQQKRDARQRFRAAVQAISEHHGATIPLSEDIVRERCGGLTGPGCSGVTLAMELAKRIAPVVASRFGKELHEVLDLIREAVTIHSIWHDAFGYAYQSAKVGPGYPYAGCALSPCGRDDPYAGQLDGILFQFSRLLGASADAACGPGCPFKLPGTTTE